MTDNTNIQFVPVETDAESGEVSLDFSEIFRQCKKHWKAFAVSIAVCFVLSVLYIISTPPTYERTATVLIKEAATRRLASSDLESMLSGASGQVSAKVVNEVIAFQSPALMQSVVQRLDLCTECSKRSLLRDIVLYGPDSPVKVQFPDIPTNMCASLRLSPVTEGEGDYRISKLRYAIDAVNVKVPGEITASFGDTLLTDMGRIVVTRTAGYTTGWETPLAVTRSTLDGATLSFTDRLVAGTEDIKNRSDVLNLKFADRSVRRADDVINTLIAIYNENWIEDKNKIAVSTSGFIAERLQALEEDLGDVDQQISSYKSSNMIPDVPAVSSLYMQKTLETTKAIEELGGVLDSYKCIKKSMEDNIGSVIPTPYINGSTAVSSQIHDYNQLLLTRNNLLAGSSEKNPLVADIDAQLGPIRAAIMEALDTHISTLEIQLANLRKTDLKTQDKIASSPTQAQYLLSVGRQQKVKESLYLYLLQKSEENQLSQAFAPYNTRVITPPMGAAIPSSPKTLLLLIFAIFMGVCIPFAVIVFKVVTDVKVRTRSDIDSLALPFLGEIPQFSRKKLAGITSFSNKRGEIVDLVVRHGNRDVVNEAFRVLRTNYEFMTKGINCPVCLLTSFNPGSGKTFIAMNLAVSFSIKGAKVLVIDGDLRHASLSDYLGNPKRGISDFLNGEVEDIRSVICNFEAGGNLSVIPVGTVPPNPSELISKPEFSQLVESMKSEYDYIFIDCPPLNIVADTQIIRDIADRTIFAIRAGICDKSAIPSIAKLQDAGQKNDLCVVLNGTEQERSTYGFYGTSYGYYGTES